MKNNELSWSGIESYLETIGMEANIDIERVKEIFRLGERMCPEEVTAIFISNYQESNGREQFKDLWLLSDNYVIEVLNFSRQENPVAEMTIFDNNIRYITVEAKEYNPAKKARENSKLGVKFVTLGDFGCNFTAFGQNCDVLNNIFENYIKGNLVRGSSSGLL